MRSADDDNTELIWHCGNAPQSTMCLTSEARFDNGREGFSLKEGAITIVRFDADRGKYYLFADVAESVQGPYTTGTYLWAKTDCWPSWERKFIEGPYIHHISVSWGNYKSVLREACKYFNGEVKFDFIEATKLSCP